MDTLSIHPGKVSAESLLFFPAPASLSDVQTQDAIAAEIRAELGRQDRRKGDLAEALGMSPASLSKRLSGDVPFTTTEIACCAIFLGVPLRQLIGA